MPTPSGITLEDLKKLDSKNLSNDEKTLFTSVIYNYVESGSNWVLLPELTSDVESMISEFKRGLCKLWKLSFGAVIEVNPNWIRLVSEGVVDAKLIDAAEEMSKQSIKRATDFAKQLKDNDIEGDVVILWDLSSNSEMVLDSEGKVRANRINVSAEFLRSLIKDSGYVLCDSYEAVLNDTVDGVAYIIAKDPNADDLSGLTKDAADKEYADSIEELQNAYKKNDEDSSEMLFL